MTHTDKHEPNDASAGGPNTDEPTPEAPPSTTDQDGTPVENPSG